MGDYGCNAPLFSFTPSKQPTTINYQPSTSKEREQPTTINYQPSTSQGQTSNQQPSTINHQLIQSTEQRLPSTNNHQRTTNTEQRPTNNHQRSTINEQPSTTNDHQKCLLHHALQYSCKFVPMDIIPTEIFGYLASLFVLLSFFMKDIRKLRFVNSIGCGFFIIYGILLPSIPVVITNIAILLVNVYYLFLKKEEKYRFRPKEFLIMGHQSCF